MPFPPHDDPPPPYAPKDPADAEAENKAGESPRAITDDRHDPTTPERTDPETASPETATSPETAASDESFDNSTDTYNDTSLNPASCRNANDPSTPYANPCEDDAKIAQRSHGQDDDDSKHARECKGIPDNSTDTDATNAIPTARDMMRSTNGDNTEPSTTTAHCKHDHDTEDDASSNVPLPAAHGDTHEGHRDASIDNNGSVDETRTIRDGNDANHASPPPYDAHDSDAVSWTNGLEALIFRLWTLLGFLVHPQRDHTPQQLSEAEQGVRSCIDTLKTETAQQPTASQDLQELEIPAQKRAWACAKSKCDKLLSQMDPCRLRRLFFSASTRTANCSGDADQVMLATDMDKSAAETTIAEYLGFLLPRGFYPDLPPHVRDRLQKAMGDEDDDDDDSSSDDEDDDPRPRNSPGASEPGSDCILQQNNSLCDAAITRLAQLPNNLARGQFIEDLFAHHITAPVWAVYADSPEHTSATAQQEQIHNFLHSLQFVDVDTKAEEPAMRHINPLTDTRCLRVVVVSNETKATTSTDLLLKDVFKLQSLHTNDKRSYLTTTKAEALLEVGVGYLPRQAQKLGDEVRAVPCFVFHVIGDYNVLWNSILKDVADFVFLEATGEPGNADNEEVFCCGRLRKRCIAWYPRVHHNARRPSPENHVAELGSFRESTRLGKLQGRMIKACNTWASSANLAVVAGIGEELVATPTLDYDFSKPRKETFVLQESFRKERQAFGNKYSRMATDEARKESDRIMKEEQQFLSDHADAQLHLPLIRQVLDIARQERNEDRVTAFHLLGRELAAKCEKHLASLLQEADSARKDATAHPKDQSLQRRVVHLSNLINESNVTLDHVWREIGQIFSWARNREAVSNLPRLAAQHMLDGHHMELFDGDALAANTKWVRAVFGELDRMLQAKHSGTPPRFLVHSMFGAQSSGKTTTANHLYGTRLKASVGRCTIGANIQLIPCKDRSEYDYVLLLDTEGVRAPEYSQMENSHRRDGVLAMLSFLLADTTTVVIPGEDDRVVRELLPIVLDAFRGSKMAERKGGQLATKVMFLYNKLDKADMSKLRAQVDSLRKTLKEAEQQVQQGEGLFFNNTEELIKQISDDAGGKAQGLGDITTPFTSKLNLEVNESRNSDVHVVGQLKAGTYPPNDTPQQEYAKLILELRDYTHRRVCEPDAETSTPREPRVLPDITTLMDSVWSCLDSTHFAVSFLSLTEKREYGRMTQAINQLQRDLTTKYREVYQEVENEVREAAEKVEAGEVEPQVQKRTRQWVSMLEAQGDMAQDEIGRKVKHVLQHFPKWKAQGQASWDEFCRKQNQHWTSLLKEVIANELDRKQEERRIQRELRKKLMREFDGNAEKFRDNAAVKQHFQTWFEKELKVIEKEHPTLAPRVPEQMRRACAGFANGHRELETAILQKDCPDPPTHVKVPQHRQGERKPFWQWVARVFAFAKAFWVEPSSTVVSHDLIRAISDRVVEDELVGCEYYADDVVSKALSRAEQEFKQSGITAKNFKEALLHAVYWKLQKRLVQIQEAWDTKNNIYCCLDKDRPSFLNLAHAVVRGLRGLELLKDSIKREVKTHWLSCFFGRFVKQHAEDLARQEFLTSPRVVLALLDLELLKLHDQGKVEKMLHLIRDSKAHFEDMTRRAAAAFLSQKVSTEFGKFAQDLQYCFRDNVLHGQGVATAQGMLRSIRQRTIDRDLIHIYDRLGHIVVPDEVEEQLKESDDSEALLRSVLLDVRNFLAEHVQPSQAQVHWRHNMGRCVQAVFTKIETLQCSDGSASDKPRCGQPCPWCNFPCLVEKGHGSRHDCEHQPAGFAGVHIVNTTTLRSGSCRQGVQEGRSMLIDGKTVPFTDFSKQFPDWTTPRMNRPQTVREYLYYKHVEDLAEHFDMCPKESREECPESYNHVKSSLKRDLHEVLESTNCSFLEDLP